MNPDDKSDRKNNPLQLGVVLILGAALGGGIGFYLGRITTPAPLARPATPAPGRFAAPDEALANEPQPDEAAGPTMPTGEPAQAAAGSPTADDLRRVDVTISRSLYTALANKLKGREADILSAHVGRLLVWWLDARRDVLEGDRLRVLYRPISGPSQLRIVALRYHSRKREKTFQAFYNQPQRATYGRYYDKEGQEVEKRLVDSPLDDYEQVTELMNLAGRRHRGVDFKTEVGTPVRTPFRVKVIRRNWNTRRNGNCLQLRSLDNGISILFLHLNQVLPVVRPGKILARGSVVAQSGNSGQSTAPHLHYELRSRSGRLLNPFEVHQTYRKKLEGPALIAFQRRRVELARLLQGASEVASRENPGDSE